MNPRSPIQEESGLPQLWRCCVRIFTRYQRGGLGERALRSRQLVEGKHFTTVWKKWLKGALELQIAIPTPTLLVGALENMGATLTQQSTQASFRLSLARVLLQMTVQEVTNYADALLAEAGSAFHSVTQNTTAKVKSMEVSSTPKIGATTQGGPADGKKGTASSTVATKQIPCKYFSSDEGCKKGSECTFKHDRSVVEKQGRCFNHGSKQGTKKDCSAKAKTRSEAGRAVKEVSG